MTAFIAGFVLVVAMAGLGQHLLTQETRATPTAWAHAVGVGMLAWGGIGLILGALHLLTAEYLLWVAGISLIGWIIPRIRTGPMLLGIVTGVVLLLPGLIAISEGRLNTDELYLHLGLPLQMLMEESLLGGPLHPNGSRPLTLTIAFATALSTDIPQAAATVHWWLSVSAIALMVQVAQIHLERASIGLLAAMVLAFSTTFATASAHAGSDIPAAFAVLLAMDAARRGHVRGAGLSAGLALSIKYTAWAPLLGACLLMRATPARRLQAGTLGLAVLSPWWARNLLSGDHALFPFTGWEDPSLQFQFLEKYGAGRDAIDFLLLPYRMVVSADPMSFEFLGRIHPYLLLLLVPGVLAIRSERLRPWTVVSTLGLLGWAAGPHWLRYLIPAMPIIALTGAAMTLPLCRGRWTRVVLGLGLVIGAYSGLQGHWLTGADPDRLVDHAGDPAVEFCNETLPDDARLALLFSWRSADIEVKQILGSVEDHNPTRHFLLANKGGIVQALRDAGATHALVRSVTFLPSNYAGMSAEQFTAEFRDPVSALDNAMLMGADLLFRSPSHRVYRIPESN